MLSEVYEGLVVNAQNSLGTSSNSVSDSVPTIASSSHNNAFMPHGNRPKSAGAAIGQRAGVGAPSRRPSSRMKYSELNSGSRYVHNQLSGISNAGLSQLRPSSASLNMKHGSSNSGGTTLMSRRSPTLLYYSGTGSDSNKATHSLACDRRQSIVLEGDSSNASKTNVGAKTKGNSLCDDSNEKKEANTDFNYVKTKESENSEPNSIEKKGGNDEETNELESLKSSDEIIIHVFDESNGVNKDFKCSRELLLREMKYFRAYLVDSCSSEDIDISVHCDVNIFQWLMDYIADSSVERRIDTLWAISILISSYFLEMERLVELCLTFVHDHIQDILKLPIELDCLNDDLVEKIAETFTIEELESVKDRRDKIVGRLYSKKLEEILRVEDNYLHRCVHCGKIFTKSQQYWSPCHKAKVHFNYYGEAICLHEVDKKWNIHSHLIHLRQTMAWRDIFWKVWGMVHSFYCVSCKSNFVVSELEHCSYHEALPVFESNENVGHYPCCNNKALKFDTSGSVVTRGCCSRMHIVSDSSSSSSVYQTVLKKQNEILVPFHRFAESGTKENVLYSHGIDQNLLDEILDLDEDEDSDDSIELDLFPTCKKYSIFDSGTMLNSNPSSSLSELTETIKKQSIAKKRYSNMDSQRIEDRKQLFEITALLAKKRVDGDRHKRFEKMKKAQRKKNIAKTPVGDPTSNKKTVTVKRRSFR